jgi:hypothetical protein
MIVRQGNTAYFQGEFDGGRPDGVVRVEQAGAEPRLRQFRNGSDVGRGDASRWQPLSFASTEIRP